MVRQFLKLFNFIAKSKLMADQLASFTEQIKNGYTFKGKSFKIGEAMCNKKAVPDCGVNLPLATLNRHGLICGATGTGKTKTLQLISEGLSDAGVPVLLMDIKGDLSGIAEPGVANDHVLQRSKLIGVDYSPTGYPVELLSLSKQPGVRLRATVSEFGPVLLSKMLGLNDTQEGLLAMLFKFCDDHQLPLLDLKDLKEVLKYAAGPGKEQLEKLYGHISTTSTGTILRNVIALEQQDADIFFGEKSFEVADLMRTASDGRGMVSIVRLTDIQDRPKLFSSFMLSLLSELYATLPEVGDSGQPKLVMFIDEAHLIFQEAGDALLQKIETIIKLIRSKGVGIFFCTQNPTDIPAPVLSQLGLKVQHALRAFTAKDRKAIKQTAENYPISVYYKTDEIITQLGIGEALITLLNEKGIPTPLVHTLLCAPRSRMDILQDAEISALIAKSQLIAKYNGAIDEQSAYEILTGKLQDADQSNQTEAKQPPSKPATTAKEAPSVFSEFLHSSVARQIGRTAGSIIVRSLLGTMGLGGRRRR
jgi:DNA helicase HerA-like ATPase